jgi:hypothetical protein
VSTIAFVDCTLLDCTGADPAPRSTVVVDGERIASVARGAAPALPRDAARVRLVLRDGRVMKDLDRVASG